MTLRNLTLLFLLSISTGLYAEVKVIARFDPSRVPLGTASSYVVEITESGAAQPSSEAIRSLLVPSISGITLRNGSTSSSQQTSIINGRADFSITRQITFDAISRSVGSYTIPSYTFEYKGTALTVPAATLTVVERSANAASATDDLVFLALDAPEKLYVGQTKPITLKLYVAESLNLRGYNSFEREADGFIVTGGPPEESTQSIEVANGRRYQVFSWPLEITPISAGKQDLGFYFDLSVVVPGQPSSRFGNSIFDDFFGRTERFSLYTKPTQVDVQPLPTREKPESFSGAIGQFNIEVSTDAESTRVGEPIMLSLKVSGQGNFDRIQGPELPESENWRSYPPESIFEAKGGDSLTGTKRFDYIFIPEKAGNLELPEVSFSFFDPDVADYVELTYPQISVKVAPSNQPRVPSVLPDNSEITATEASKPELIRELSSEDLLRTLDYQPKKGRNLTGNSISIPFILWLNGMFLVLFSTLTYFLNRRKQFIQSPEYAIVSHAKKELTATQQAVKSDDAEVFYSAAQKAVRLAATILFRRDLHSANAGELEQRFSDLKISETIVDQVRDLFEAADNQRFSGQTAPTDLSSARAQLKAILEALSK